jgi:hypothetical protein
MEMELSVEERQQLQRLEEDLWREETRFDSAYMERVIAICKTFIDEGRKQNSPWGDPYGRFVYLMAIKKPPGWEHLRSKFSSSLLLFYMLLFVSHLRDNHNYEGSNHSCHPSCSSRPDILVGLHTQAPTARLHGFNAQLGSSVTETHRLQANLDGWF